MEVLLYSPDQDLHGQIASLPCFAATRVVGFTEYAAAREAFDLDRHRLVLVEAENADSDGLSLCRKIRAAAHSDRLVMVLLAADDDPFLHRLALQAGVDDVVERTVDSQVLDVRLAAAKRRATRIEAARQAETASLAIKHAMDRMQLGVTITSLDGEILYTNEAEARMHGYKPEELIGQSVRVLSPPDSWNPLGPEQARNMKSWRRESVNLRKDGSEFQVQLLSDVVLDSEGEPVAIVTVCEDITERKLVQEELGNSRDELSSRVRERTTELLEANIRLQHEILERRKAERQLLYEALHDSLTDLPNRSLFHDRLSRVLAGADRHPDQLFAVLYLDLDQYKVVAESLGPEAGDRLLVQAADRLRNSLRPEDTIGCAGRDEFLVLVEDLRDANDATRVARRIQKNLAAPMEIASQTVFTTASIGIALSTTGYDRPEDMVRDAQIAMFRAQAGTGGGHVIFDSEMHERAVERMRLEMELRQAVDDENFKVHYQPIVELSSGRVEGFEALARWNTSDGNPVPPNEFIPLAEEIGTIFELERQILRQVCCDITQWRRLVGESGPYISVNLSGKELAHPEFAELVRLTLEEFAVDPKQLRFEVTESSIAYNEEVAIAVLAQLKQLGVGVYVDDFGTGYSSLSTLHSFPIDTLKIDQSFVSGGAGRPGNWEIVRVIIGLANNMGLGVIAEGIETSEQLEAIRELGCHLGQGFLFSKPVQPSEVRRFLDSGMVEFEA
jgi:diguanylate cyclase (GGDEF)-like protein/PAS domain S-box-containing protein